MAIHILLVDDDAASLLAVSAALQLRLSNGGVVDTAPDANLALKVLTMKRYDIVHRNAWSLCQ